MQSTLDFLRKTKMVNIHKKAIFAIATVSVAVALIAMIAYPAYAAGADYRYAMNEGNWAVAEEYTSNVEATSGSEFTVQIDAKGYAFARIDAETIKQYNSTTCILIHVQPATETTERKIDITGTVKVNDATYTMSGGKVFIGKEKKLIFVNGTGTDEDGNEITLKFGARYFWWGGKAYAFRSAALLQTAEGQMLLLQRGIAKIQ
jgi:hypothetical protein